MFPHDQDTFSELVAPTEVLSFEEADGVEKVRRRRRRREGAAAARATRRLRF